MSCTKAIAYFRFCMLSNVPDLAQKRRPHEIQKLIREVGDRLRLTDVQAQRAAPILENCRDAQRDILARHTLGADDQRGRGKSRGLQAARRLQRELEAVRSATLASTGERLALEQLDELPRVQDERKSELRSRLTSGI